MFLSVAQELFQLSLGEFVLLVGSWVILWSVGQWYIAEYLRLHSQRASCVWEKCSKLLFVTTFTVSGSLFELILFEICDVLPRTFRLLDWKVSLLCVCVLLKVIIPAMLVASILRQHGLPRYAQHALSLVVLIMTYSLMSMWVSVPFVVLYWCALWQIGENLPLDDDAKPQPGMLPWDRWMIYFVTDFFSVEHSVSRLSVLGVAAAAILSGFASVNFPLEQMLAHREGEYFEGSSSLSHSEAEEIRVRDKGARLLCEFANAATVARKTEQFLSKLRSPSPLLPPGLASGAAAATVEKRAKALESEIRVTQQLVEEMFMELVWTRELQDRAKAVHTPMGVVMKWSSYLLAGLCLMRVVQAAASVLQSMDAQQRDSVTTALDFVLIRLDTTFWAPLLSFSLVICLALLQVRGFLVCMQNVSHMCMSLTSGGVYPLLLAYLAGTYFVASVLLMRTHLPPTYRRVVSMVLGPQVHFSFFHKWFDIVFLGSVCVSACVIYVSHRQKLCAAQQLTLSHKS